MNKKEILADLEQIKSSLEELETQRDDIQILCIKSELELSIGNILLDYKRVLKENESLQKTYDDCYCKYKHYKQFESISIQKVKDKIRKNEEIIDISNDGDLMHELLQKNKVYEELLESE